MPGTAPHPGETIESVRSFWDEHPLFAGESRFEPGTLEFFEEHRRVYVDDCFAGRIDPRIFPPPESCDAVLDLGCGAGMWSVELQRERTIGRFHSADLTETACELTRRRLALYGLASDVREQNAERLTYPDGTFTHVNCLGVIHHTPDAQRAVAEIHRVLRPGGTACISVYYRNLLLRSWPVLGRLARPLLGRKAGLKGRGREGIFDVADVDEIVRLYDGEGNPIGRHYSRKEFRMLLAPPFEIERIFFNSFPARALPVRMPRAVHRVLNRAMPFLIYANVRRS